jgi:hypothetical protein
MKKRNDNQTRSADSRRPAALGNGVCLDDAGSTEGFIERCRALRYWKREH